MDERILDKLDSIQEDITEMKVTQGKQHITLEEHTRRSTANEARIKHVENVSTKTDSRLDTHFKALKWALWACTGLFGILQLIWPLIKNLIK